MVEVTPKRLSSGMAQCVPALRAVDARAIDDAWRRRGPCAHLHPRTRRWRPCPVALPKICVNAIHLDRAAPWHRSRERLLVGRDLPAPDGLHVVQRRGEHRTASMIGGVPEVEPGAAGRCSVTVSCVIVHDRSRPARRCERRQLLQPGPLGVRCTIDAGRPVELVARHDVEIGAVVLHVVVERGPRPASRRPAPGCRARAPAPRSP